MDKLLCWLLGHKYGPWTVMARGTEGERQRHVCRRCERAERRVIWKPEYK